MNSTIWNLPGPAAFLHKVSESLCDGKNVVLRLPEWTQRDVVTAVKYEQGEIGRWNVIDTNSTQSTLPLHILFDIYVPNFPAKCSRDSSSLLTQDSFLGRIIVLENLSKARWGKWIAFLEKYERACRELSLLDRTVFLVPTYGELTRDCPAEDVCLVHHSWTGVVDSIDISILASQILADSSYSHFMKRFIISVCTNIALWDFDLCMALLENSSDALLNPLPVLEKFIQNRSWTGKTVSDIAKRWEQGVEDEFDGRYMMHSAAVAASKDIREIERRIWSAEVSMLFPLIEEKRHELLDELSDVLIVPHITNFGGIINDIRDLEIGHIKYQLDNNPSICSTRIYRYVSQLKEIRDKLAHLEPLGKNLLLYDEILNEHRNR